MSLRNAQVFAAGIGLLFLAAGAAAAPLEVIYSEVVASPNSIVPGAKDAAGNPVVTNWLAIEDLAVRPDGGQWVVKGRSTLATTLDSILILGSGSAGTAFCQDGQPVQGGAPGELYDFFDSPSPVSWNDQGDIGFSFRAKGGVASVFEKVVVYSAATQTHTIVLQMGDLALDLIDVPANPTGDERFGNSIGGVQMLNDGTCMFGNTPIQNCHSTRYPAVFRGHKAFRQSGVSIIEGEVWDSFDYNGCGGTPDGLHWFLDGDTERPDTTTDAILVVDDVVVLRENTLIPNTNITVGASGIFFTRMLPNGDWFARGDDTADNDWAMRNGVVVAQTGDEITPGLHWGAVFSAFTGNSLGDWVLAGSTDSGDPDKELVLVFNGTEIIAAEGDPIDVNGNGLFDDDAYINTFQPDDLFLTDQKEIWLLVTLRNGAGTLIGDAFLRTQLKPPACPGDANCDGVVSWRDIDYFIAGLNDNTAAWEALFPPPGPSCGFVNLDCQNPPDGHVTWRDIDPFVALLNTVCP